MLRSHFGFVLNAGDPHSCTTGYVPSASTPSQGAVENVDTDGVQCRVVNGVDPNAGDGYDENGSNIRGEQNIGRDGGQGAAGPTGAIPGGGAARAAHHGAVGAARRTAARQPDRHPYGLTCARRRPIPTNDKENRAGDERSAGTCAGRGGGHDLRRSRRRVHRSHRGGHPRRGGRRRRSTRRGDRRHPRPGPAVPPARRPWGRRRRRRPVRPPGLSIPLVPTLRGAARAPRSAAGAFLWFTRPGESAVRTGDYVEALQAARSGVVDLTSFDYLTLDDDIEQIRRVTTGDLREESVAELDERRQEITDLQAVVNTEVVGAGVTRANGGGRHRPARHPVHAGERREPAGADRPLPHRGHAGEGRGPLAAVGHQGDGAGQ